MEHSWNAGAVTAEPSCTKEGAKLVSCVNCDATKEETIPCTDHTWIQDGTEQKPNCTEEIQITLQCSVCEQTKSQTVSPVGHKWDNGEVTRQATTQTHGEITYTCSVCGEKYTEEIEKLPTEETTLPIQPSNPQSTEPAIEQTTDDSWIPGISIGVMVVLGGAASVYFIRKKRK